MLTEHMVNPKTQKCLKNNAISTLQLVARLPASVVLIKGLRIKKVQQKYTNPNICAWMKL